MNSEIFKNAKSYMNTSSVGLSEIAIFFKRYKKIHQEIGLLITDLADDFDTNCNSASLSIFLRNVMNTAKEIANDHTMIAE